MLWAFEGCPAVQLDNHHHHQDLTETMIRDLNKIFRVSIAPYPQVLKASEGKSGMGYRVVMLLKATENLPAVSWSAAEVLML